MMTVSGLGLVTVPTFKVFEDSQCRHVRYLVFLSDSESTANTNAANTTVGILYKRVAAVQHSPGNPPDSFTVRVERQVCAQYTHTLFHFNKTLKHFCTDPQDDFISSEMKKL